MKVFQTAMAAALYLAAQSYAATVLAEPADGALGTGTDDDAGGEAADGVAVEAVATMVLEPTVGGGVTNNVDAYDALVLETVSVQQDPLKVLDSSAGAPVYGVALMQFKWRGWAATQTLQSADHTNAAARGTDPSAAAALTATVTSASGARVWFREWAALEVSKASGSTWFLNGLAFKGCDVLTTASLNAGACSTAVLAPGGAYAGTHVDQKRVGTYSALLGPLVKFQAVGTHWIWKVKGFVVTNLCLNAKIVPTAAWTVTFAAVDYHASDTADKTVANTSLNTAPAHNMDVPDWTACVMHFACATANADDCAGTTGVTIKFPRSRATLAAGKSVKVTAFVSTNLWY